LVDVASHRIVWRAPGDDAIEVGEDDSLGRNSVSGPAYRPQRSALTFRSSAVTKRCLTAPTAQLDRASDYEGQTGRNRSDTACDRRQRNRRTHGEIARAPPDRGHGRSSTVTAGRCTATAQRPGLSPLTLLRGEDSQDAPRVWCASITMAGRWAAGWQRTNLAFTAQRRTRYKAADRGGFEAPCAPGGP